MTNQTKSLRVAVQSAAALTGTIFLFGFVLPLTTHASVNAPITPEAARMLQTQSFSMVNENPVAVAGARDSYTVTDPPPKTDIASYKAFSASIFSNNLASAIQWPFRVGVPISDGFGPRARPCETCSANHQGVDFTPGEGSEIQAIADGVVTKVNTTQVDGGLGVFVAIDHKIDGKKVTSVYGHMLPDSVSLQPGDKVRLGDLVGKVGNTGISTGPHLHFEIHIDGIPIDPIPWLTEHNK